MKGQASGKGCTKALRGGLMTVTATLVLASVSKVLGTSAKLVNRKSPSGPRDTEWGPLLEAAVGERIDC